MLQLLQDLMSIAKGVTVLKPLTSGGRLRVVVGRMQAMQTSIALLMLAMRKSWVRRVRTRVRPADLALASSLRRAAPCLASVAAGACTPGQRRIGVIR